MTVDHLFKESVLSDEYAYSILYLLERQEAADKETYRHCVNVKTLAMKIAKALGGFSDREILFLEWGCLLHDVGKLKIPYEITAKPGPLSTMEYEKMKTHPVEGCSIVATYPLPTQVTDIIMFHHEHYNGTGYPSGLAQNDIPLSARICSVVDAYDAMVSDRPYREAMSDENALTEITKNSGTQFDPVVVRAFQSIRRNSFSINTFE